LTPIGEPVGSPIELDLRQDTDTKIVCIPPGENPFDPPMPVAASANGAPHAHSLA
jgi:hypothetical protein